MTSRLLFFSPRLRLLRAVSLFIFLGAAVSLWALTIPPRTEWAQALGAEFWWVPPAALAALILALPVAMAWLHGRYVLELAEEEGGALRVTTFLLCGTRTRHLAPGALTGSNLTLRDPARDAPYLRLRHRSLGIDWILDLQGDFPEGVEAMEERVR
ncbi:MAG TPA: hypothetical protein VHN79_07675 [Lacunisphaera sp.]|nr:hypothetical protein [Lacunisphaera sp.]